MVQSVNGAKWHRSLSGRSLRGSSVADTLTLMARKTVQVRIPADLGGDVALVAAALDKTVPQYVEDVLRAAVAKDLPRAAQIARDRADAVAKQPRRPHHRPSDS